MGKRILMCSGETCYLYPTFNFSIQLSICIFSLFFHFLNRILYLNRADMLEIQLQMCGREIKIWVATVPFLKVNIKPAFHFYLSLYSGNMKFAPYYWPVVSAVCIVAESIKVPFLVQAPSKLQSSISPNRGNLWITVSAAGLSRFQNSDSCHAFGVISDSRMESVLHSWRNACTCTRA